MTQTIQGDRIARLAQMTSPENEGATLEEMFQRMTCRVAGVEGPEGRPEGLPSICSTWNVPYGRVLTWLMADAKRYAVYERALEVRAHELISEVVDIADGDQFPQEKRVRIDTRFRVAEAHAAEKYGKKMQLQAPAGALLDAGLVGTAVALLQRLSQSRSGGSNGSGREIDVTPSRAPPDTEDIEGEI